LLAGARERLDGVRDALAGHPDIFHAGFVHDAQKEYVEASLTIALVGGEPLPAPEDLHVEYAAYLNGMGEAVGELRRYLLDSLRHGDIDRCERYLASMDDIYAVMVTIDFPDAITGGLRRTTDIARGIIEKTRGDLTVAARQRDLEQRLAAFERGMRDGGFGVEYARKEH
jgi:translin